MSIFLILLALAILIAGAWRGMSVLVLAPVLAMLAALASGMPVLAGYTQVFMQAAGDFVVAFFPLFLLGALFGKVMEASGAAARLATAIVIRLGPQNAIVAVVLSLRLADLWRGVAFRGGLCRMAVGARLISRRPDCRRG